MSIRPVQRGSRRRSLSTELGCRPPAWLSTGLSSKNPRSSALAPRASDGASPVLKHPAGEVPGSRRTEPRLASAL